MIITCCDSRVLISEIFGNEPGDFFIHRNIANLVPPHEPDGRAHGTSAAIEFAVIPKRAPSRAITFVNAITPPLAAE